MSSIKKIVIIGIGGTCLDILDTILDINDSSNPEKWGGPFECLGFIGDNQDFPDQHLMGFPYLGALNKAQDLNDCCFINGIGSPRSYKLKKKIIENLGLPRERFLSIAHPTASVSRSAKIGSGVTIFQNVTLTSNASVGDHVVVLPNTVISHDATIGAFSCVAGGVCISGNATIGENCYLGTNCSVKDGVTVGSQSLVAMGAVVIDDIDPHSVVKGIPAR